MSLNKAHQGYEYQDLLTVYFILKEILDGNMDSIFSIDKKHTISNEDKFDDVVIENKHGIQRKQIKYSDDSTSKKLTKDDCSSGVIALHKLFKSWKGLNNSHSEFRLCLAWGTPQDENIRSVLDPTEFVYQSFDSFDTKLYKINLDKIWVVNPENFNRWDSLKKYVTENQIDRGVFQEFCDSLVIELEFPKEEQLKAIILDQIKKLGIGQYPNEGNIHDFIERFAKKVSQYRAKSAQVTVEIILNDLRVKTDYGRIEQKFEIDQSKNIVSDVKLDDFYDLVISNNKTALVGEPGSGKSWFLTNFIEYANSKDIRLIRHYCFTGTDDDLRMERIKSDVFFGNLISDILKHYPDLQTKKEELFASNLNELNILLSKIHENLIIIIDGLDHIDRILKSSVGLSIDQTQIVNFIKQIQASSTVSIVLGSQPIVDVDELVENYGYIKHSIPKWEHGDVVNSMLLFDLENINFKEKLLSQMLLDKSEGNPLYLTYLIKTLKGVDGITIDHLEQLPQYDFNLKAYYEYLTAQVNDNVTSETLSCIEFTVNREELRSIIPRSSHLDRNLNILAPVVNENFARGGIKLYHDSFRRYIYEKLSSDDMKSIYREIIDWLLTQGFFEDAKAYRNLLGYYFRAEQYDEIKKFATNDFLTQSVFYGYSENAIKINYHNFLITAKTTQDWPLYIYLSELNRALYMTLSTEYQSEQEVNFEPYFEAISLIYGFEKANQMLYYDGQKNFSDELIAKAFYISQKNGFTPNWCVLDEYFKGEISLEQFKYFIAYLIGVNSIDEFCRDNAKKLLSAQYTDFLEILITEITTQIGFEKIKEFFDYIPNKKQDYLGNIINNILDTTNCNQRILIKQKPKSELEPLSLDFATNFIDQGKLEEFFFLIKQYFLYDCSILRDFEKTIPETNFFYNWVKFSIRNYLLEDDINLNRFSDSKEIEVAYIKNLQLLASDVEPFNGQPRAIDLTTQHSILLRDSIKNSFRYINSKEGWNLAIGCVENVSFGTNGYLQNTQMGILPPGNLVDLLLDFLNESNKQTIIELFEKIDSQSDELYGYHLEYSLKNSILHAKIKEIDKAKDELKKASLLMTAYTFRKDITLSELIEPLSVINKLDIKFAKKYAKKLKYLNEAVQKHTEGGKGIKWLIIQWFEELLNIDYKLAAQYLIYEFLEHEYFWKLENMLVGFISHSQDINTVVSNFLYRSLPTNTNDKYIAGFLDNVNRILPIDERLARTSVINILSRDLNNSYETLSGTTMTKLEVLKHYFGLNKEITSNKEEANYKASKGLQDKLEEYLNIQESLRTKSLDELIELFDRDGITEKQAIFLFYYLQENYNEEKIKDFISKIIEIKHVDKEFHFDHLLSLIDGLNLSDDTKIYLFVRLFINSKDGWFSMFIKKEALAQAVSIEKNMALECLSLLLYELFGRSGLGISSTSNLIIAFEYAGLEKKLILAMYKRAFKFINNRLPDKQDTKWKTINKIDISNMNRNEIALVVLLTRLKNMDVTVQKEIIYAINYLLTYDEKSLIKPIKWFFDNLKFFPVLSIASILEIFIAHAETKIDYFKIIQKDLIKAKAIKNLYVQNCLKEIFQKIVHV